MVRRRPAAPSDAPEPSATLMADPRPRNRPGLIVAVILYATALLALAVLGMVS